jgi:hypothetical protein
VHHHQFRGGVDEDRLAADAEQRELALGAGQQP